VVAGIVAKLNKLNGLRLAAGKPPLGFLNPFLYQNSSAFHDVTVGKNDYNPNGYGSMGFKAIRGWDAASGLGTPDYPALAAAVSKLP